MAFVTDLFTETNDTSLGSHTPDSGGTWTSKWDTTNATIVASEDRVRGDSDSLNSLYYHSADPASNEYDIEATLRLATGSNLGNPGILARAVVSGSLRNYIIFIIQKTFSQANLQEVVNGSVVETGTWNTTFNFDTDYNVKLEVRNGTNGVKLIESGTTRAQITGDQITSAGKVGLIVRLNGRVDNFVASDLSSTADGVGSSSGTFTASGVGAANVAGTGSSSGTFSASGFGESTNEAAGSSSGTFSASGVGSQVVQSDGSASLTFSVFGEGGSAAAGEASGNSAFSFSASGEGGANVASSGSASLAFSASAGSPSVVEGVGIASLDFSVNGFSPQEFVPQVQVGGGVSGKRRKRRFILPDGQEVYATEQEVYSLLDAYVKPKEKKKTNKVVRLRDQIEFRETTPDKPVRVEVKPISIFEPDQEKYNAAVFRMARRRRTIELLLLAA